MDATHQQYHYFGQSRVSHCQNSYRTYPPAILFDLFFDVTRPIHWARDPTTGYIVVSRVEGRLPDLFGESNYLGTRSTEPTGRATIPARYTDQGIDRAYLETLSTTRQNWQLSLEDRLPLDHQITAGSRIHWLSSEPLLRAGQKATTDREMQRKQAICYVLPHNQNKDNFTEFQKNPVLGPESLLKDDTDLDSPITPSQVWSYFIGRFSPPIDYPITCDGDQVSIKVVDSQDTEKARDICLGLDDYRRWLLEGFRPKPLL